jgi:hypothetical protein
MLLHGLLLWWIIQRVPKTRSPASTVAIHVDLRMLPSVPKHAPARPVRQTSPTTVAQLPAHPARPPPLASTPTHGQAAEGPPGSRRGEREGSHAPDAPMTAKLIPRLPPGMFESGNGEGSSHGVTLHNDGAEPDPEAQAAYDAERAARRVQGWATEQLADARAQRGQVSGYFDDMKRAFEQELDASPPAVDGKALGSAKGAAGLAFGSLLEQAQRYGHTGTPLPEVDPDVQDVHDRYSSNAQAMIRDPAGMTPMGSIGAAIEAGSGGAVAQQMRQHVQEQMGLNALVELFQRRDGSVREAKLARTSGNKAFDEGVVAAAPKAIAKLKPPTGVGLGTNPEEIHSLWQFQGTLRYKKNVKDLKHQSAGRVALDTLAAVGTGQLGFDETQGVEVLDLAHPTVEFTAKLLRLY